MYTGIKIGIIAAVSAAGVGTGIFGAKLLRGGRDVDDNLVQNANIAETDGDHLYNRYLELKDNAQDFTSEFTEQELANLSLTIFGKHENNRVTTIGTGVATMNIEQRIWALGIRDGDKYFEESCSKSNFVAITDRMYQEGDNTTYYFTGNQYDWTPSDKDFENCEGKVLSNEEYADFMGRNISNPCIYFINDTTVIENGAANRADTNSGIPTSATKTDDGYVVELELDNLYGVRNYVRQMKAISNLSKYPTFEYVHLTFELDETLDIKYMRAREKYYARTSKGVGSTVEARLDVKFEHDGGFTLPSLTDEIVYPESF